MTFLTAEWRNLVILNYSIEAQLLEPYVPFGTALELWRNEAIVSILGFQFLRVRVLGCAVPAHTDFSEVNLRFYVTRNTVDGIRRGVVFIKELVPLRAVATIARFCYGENYHAVPMSHDISSQTFAYTWRGGRLAMTIAGDLEYPRAGSEEQFIIDHHWGYTKRGTRTIEYKVERPDWRVAHAVSADLLADVSELYGRAFVDALSRPPRSAFFADGSMVRVSFGRRVAP
jgi:uncharacterized protein YqjF (DUF2071 family)